MLLPDNKSTASLPIPSDSAPPPYTAGPTLVPQSLPAQNHLKIQRDNGAVIGSYLIDVSLPGGAGKNLSLASHNGAVDAKVYLAGEAKGAAEVEGHSHNGYVSMCICDRPTSLPLHLIASTHNGYVLASLPPSFTGPLTIRAQNGMISILPSLRTRLRVLEDTRGERRCWVGEGWEDEKDWMGDTCLLETKNGMVTVGFWEGASEQDEEKKEKAGWACAFMPWCK